MVDFGHLGIRLERPSPFWHASKAYLRRIRPLEFSNRKASVVKKQWGRWQVDTEASTLVYESGQELRIFSIAPGAAFSASEILAWIMRAHPRGRHSANEIRDLREAIGDLVGWSGRPDS